MLSFQELYTRTTNLISDSDSATQTLMQDIINDGYHEILQEWDWWFSYKSATETTVASQQAYRLPYDIDKLKSVTVTVSSVAYPIEEVSDEDFWNQLNARSTNYTSDIPQFFFIKRDELLIYPTPSSASNTITFYYKRIAKDLAATDYTTGTITTLTNGLRAVTGNGTTWTAAFVGRYFRVNSDGYWYEIASRSSNTAITIRKNYGGTSIAAGTEAYTIGDMPLLPEGYHDMLVNYAVSYYYRQKQETGLATMYENLYARKLQKLIEVHGNKTTSAILKGMDAIKNSVTLTDPNQFPISLG